MNSINFGKLLVYNGNNHSNINGVLWYNIEYASIINHGIDVFLLVLLSNQSKLSFKFVLADLI